VALEPRSRPRVASRTGVAPARAKLAFSKRIDMTTEPALLDLVAWETRPTFRLAPGAGNSLLRYLAGKQLLSQIEVHATEAETVVLASAGSLAHDAFPPKSAVASPPFAQFVLRIGPQPFTVTVGGISAQTCFSIELRGVLNPSLAGPLKDRLVSMLYLDLSLATRPHEGLMPAPPPVETAEPAEKQPKRAVAPVGVRVEEL
jgi:hypothetical protein